MLVLKELITPDTIAGKALRRCNGVDYTATWNTNLIAIIFLTALLHSAFLSLCEKNDDARVS
jgi:hypothetical protein